MNWKDVPHLFANGKFKVMINDGYSDLYIEDIIGINYDAISTETCDSVQLNECEALIACPISDMTDEEIHKATEHMIRPHSMSFDVKKLLNNKDDFRLALNLISIGVLPKLFEEGFKTGTVINVNEI